MRNIFNIGQLIVSISLAAALSACSSDSATDNAADEILSLDTSTASSSGIVSEELEYGDVYWARLAQDYERFEVPSYKQLPTDFVSEGRWGPIIDLSLIHI